MAQKPTVNSGNYYCTQCGTIQSYPDCGLKLVYMSCRRCNTIEAFFLGEKELIKYWEDRVIKLKLMIAELEGRLK